MVAWSTTDKTNITLSGSNLTATKSAAAAGGVRLDTSFTGKRYFEFVLSTSTNHAAIGWANATASTGAQLGVDKNGFAYRPQRGEWMLNNVTSGTPTPRANGGVSRVVRVAVDFTALRAWVALGDDFWNALATEDPGTGTGGFDISTLNAGPYFPFFGSDDAGSAGTINCGAGDMWYAIPSGFSTLDTNVQAFEATSKMEGLALLAPPKNTMITPKMIGYGMLSAPANSVVCSKLIGYAILADVKPPMRSRTRDTAYLRF
jgi:hypothetical protein